MHLIHPTLSKLTISASKDREGKMLVGSMNVMFNPESIQQNYKTRFLSEDTINQVAHSNQYVTSEPSGLSLTLLFDARAIDSMNQTIDAQLAELKSLCCVSSVAESPYFLRVEWGGMRWQDKPWFAGRATDLFITYTLFDCDATPLQATAMLNLVTDESFVIQDTLKTQDAPAQAIVHIEGETSLPLAANEASHQLGSEVSAADLAFANDLDSLDSFQQVQSLAIARGDGV